MSRVLLLGSLVALFLLMGRAALAEDAAPGAPPAKAGGAAEVPPRPAVPAVDPYAPPPPTLAGARPARVVTSDCGIGRTQISEGMVLKAIPPGATERLTNPWSGTVNLRYRLRTTNDPASYWDVDQDVYSYLRLNYGDEDVPGFSGSFHGRLAVDVDDFGNVDGYNQYDSITDTYSSRWNPRVYHAYVNYTTFGGPMRSARLGRLWIDVGEYITFDGLRVESATLPWGCTKVAAFAGMPTYLFTEAFTGDFVGGLQLSGTPWDGAEWHVDWTYEKSDSVYGNLADNFFNVTWNQRIGTSSMARLVYQHLDDDPRRFKALIDAVWPQFDVVFRGYFDTLITSQLQRVYDFDYYYWTALALDPYWQAHASASKAFGECLDGEVGFTIRRLYDNADEGVYNREWEQYFAAISTYDWLARGLSFTLTGEFWNSTSDFGTAVFDVEYKPSRAWRFVLGTDYSAYSYDIFADQERVDVYSAYGRVAWRPNQCWLFDLRLRVEDDDFGTYTRVDAMAQFNF